MSRLFAAFLLIVVLAIGGSAIAATAYQAGVTTGAATVVTDGSTVVAPIVVPAWGFQPGFGFGFLGLLGTIVFLILVFGLFRAIIGGGRHRHGWGPNGGAGWGPGGPGTWGPGPDGQGGGNGPSSWGRRDRFRSTFEEWHRESHAASGTTDHPAEAHDTPPPPTTPA